MAPRHSYVPSSLAFDPALSVTAKSVALIIGVYMNPTKGAFPGHERIAAHLSISASTVHRAVEELTAKGHMTVSRRQRGPNVYRWLGVSPVTDQEPLDMTPTTLPMYQPRQRNVPSDDPKQHLERSKASSEVGHIRTSLTAFLDPRLKEIA